ncbi:unnamed protein product [Rhodiola kirilowii]
MAPVLSRSLASAPLQTLMLKKGGGGGSLCALKSSFLKTNGLRRSSLSCGGLKWKVERSKIGTVDFLVIPIHSGIRIAASSVLGFFSKSELQCDSTLIPSSSAQPLLYDHYFFPRV